MVTAMRRTFISSLGFWIVLAGIALYFIYPPMKQLKFGSDLVGGRYITLGVKTGEAVVYELQSLVQAGLNTLKTADKIEPVAVKPDAQHPAITISFSKQEDALKAQQVIESDYREHYNTSKDIKFNLVGNDLVVKFSERKEEEIRKTALLNDKEVLRTRLNAIGVEEVPVSIHGKDRIVVELPDVQDPIQAKKMIGTPAMLEFRIVEEGPAASREELLDKFNGEIPEGMEILEGRDRRSEGVSYYLVPNYSEVTGRYLLKAKPQMGQARGGQMGMLVAFEFNAEGGDKFYQMTSQNLGRLLAAILDKKVISAATIQDKIRRHGTISGQFSPEEAKELATMFKSGAFSAPVTFEEERNIGPALGQDLIKRGLIACGVAITLLFIFSVVLYKLSGLFAFFVLLYNLLMVLFILRSIHAALTLPGIAGLALTVGMAIDSSILIFEKIRELLAQGVPVPQAVRQGFASPLSIILDANIMNFIVCVILYNFGTGPIKGFAITTMIGIIMTLISGLLVLRSIFEAWLSRDIQKLSI